MRPVLLTVLCLMCIAIGAALVPVAERFDKDFSSPSSDGPGIPVQTDAPVRFYSCMEKQRIMRDEKLYKGAIDGLRGPLTSAAEIEHNKLYNDWANKEIWPEVK